MEFKRFVLQKIILPTNRLDGTEDLYIRRPGVPFVDLKSNEEGAIQVFNKCRLSFDTYFNTLSLLKWVTYTHVNNVKLAITVKGKFKLTLLHMYLESNRRLIYKTLSTKTIFAHKKTTLDFDFNTETPFGGVSFVLESLSDESYYYDSYYFTNINESYIKPVKLGIGICTYKREDYIKHNIDNILHNIIHNHNCPLKDQLEIFVSDNAGTLPKFNNEHIHIAKNKNTGGSGGFTRCMLEALKFNSNDSSKLTHLIMMDDDVILDYESIVRTHTILSILKPKYKNSFIGGAMFNFDKPYMQHASGEYWHGDHCESFIDTYNKNRDMRDLINILENENFTDANYQAWWYCAIPMSIIRYDNLPLPFFIKSDDIEYSVRNAKHIILLNGICVWHESFESKYSAQNEYYTVRNYLISAASKNVPLSKERITSFFIKYVKHYVSNYKYLEIEYFCRAINDFLKGTDYVKQIDLEKCHKEVLNRGYKIVDAKQLPVHFTKEDYYRNICNDPGWRKSRLWFAKLTINGLLLPAKGYAILGMWGGSHSQTYRKKFLIRYEPSTNKAFILERNLKTCLKMLRLVRKTLKNIEKRFDWAYNDFSQNWNKLITYENWQKQLGLNETLKNGTKKN